MWLVHDQHIYLDLPNSLLSGHLKGVSVLGTQEELHLDAVRKCDKTTLCANRTTAEIRLLTLHISPTTNTEKTPPENILRCVTHVF